MAEIGKRIKAKREELGITQEELASRLGYKSKTTIAKIENGTNDIVQSKVVAFAEALGTTTAYLMGWETLPSAAITLYNVHCETEDESELILSYRDLSTTGKEKVSKYTNGLLSTEKAEAELNAAHDKGATAEQKKHADDIMMDDSEWE